MVAKYQQYKAYLKGVNSAEFYINKLQTDSCYRVIIEKNEDSFLLQIIEAVKTNPDISEIESNIAERAINLKLNIPELVKETAKDIDSAYQAEQIVKEGILSVLFQISKENATAEITLAVMADEVDQSIMNLCDHYAYIRIMELINTLDMTLSGNIKKLGGND